MCSPTLRQAVDEDFECLAYDCISTPDASIRNSCEKMILTEVEFGALNEFRSFIRVRPQIDV